MFFRIKKNIRNGRFKIVIDFSSERSLFVLSKSATRWQLNRHNLYSATVETVKHDWGFPCRFCFWKIKMIILLLNFFSLFLSLLLAVTLYITFISWHSRHNLKCIFVTDSNTSTTLPTNLAFPQLSLHYWKRWGKDFLCR